MDHRTLTAVRRIKDAADAKEISVRQLADQTGIGFGTLQGILTGAREPRLTHLYILADALGINVGELVRADAA